MDDAPLPTLSQLKALRVVDLKERLSALGLPQSGLKKDLIERLDGHFNKIREQRAQMQLQQQQQHLPPQLNIPEHPQMGMHMAAAAAAMMASPTHHPQQPAPVQMMSPQHHMLSPQNQQMHQQLLSPPHHPQQMAQQMLSPGGGGSHLPPGASPYQQQPVPQVYQTSPPPQVLAMVQEQQQQQQFLQEQQQQAQLLQQQAAQSQPQPVLLERRQEDAAAPAQQVLPQEPMAAEVPVEPAQQIPPEAQPDVETESLAAQPQSEPEPEPVSTQQQEEAPPVTERTPVVEEPCVAKHIEPLYQEQQEQQQQPDEPEAASVHVQEEERVPVVEEPCVQKFVQPLGDEEQEKQENQAMEQAQPNEAMETSAAEEQAVQERQQEEETPEEKETPAVEEAQPEAEVPLSKPPLTVFPRSGAVVEKAPAIIHRPVAAFGAGGGDLEDDPTPAGPIQRVAKCTEAEEAEVAGKDEALHLPKVLEDALAYNKMEMETKSTVQADEARQGQVIDTNLSQEADNVDDSMEAAAEEEAGQGDKKDKQGKKGKKKKKKKRNRPEEWARQAAEAERRKLEEEERSRNPEPEVEVEYVQEKPDLDPTDPMYRTFSKIFDAFKIVDEDEEKQREEAEEAERKRRLEQGLTKVPKQILEEEDKMRDDDDMDAEDEDDDGKQKLSKRKMKKLNRLSVAELKQLVARPDVVEMHDVTARDPRLLVHLKSARNTVPVPRHWCFKRKYLQGKRGIEKPPFNLPDFIKKTGIMEMRAALQEKEESKGLKAKMREKVRPKLGKIDIDYQKLHDAFFKWQTKPKMTLHGDLYYEGKEFEIRLKEKKPGDLTDDLRTALGMPVGPNAHKVPPPWLIAMQRYGPPPSYPNLKIPGLNAPIPDGCSFGYHAGGWGKPPVDESGRPLYGDVFGTSDGDYGSQAAPEEIDTSLWGELESESEEEEEEESSDEEEAGGDEEGGEKEGEEGAAAAAAAGMQTPVMDSAGLTTPSGMSSVGLGLGGETPELLELRKRRIEAEMDSGEQTPNLYQVLPEKRSAGGAVGAAMMGSTHTYDVRKAGVGGGGDKAGAGGGAVAAMLDTGGVELALNPEEVDLMDTDAMQARAEAALRAKQASLAKEDLSDMVAEHAAKQSSKRKRAAAKDEKGGRDGGSAAKKYKDFKF